VEGNHHVARVTVSDEAWARFRHVALAQGIPVSRYLGRLVEAELERRKPRPVRRVSGAAGEIEDGLAALREVRLAIDELDAIAGRLARETANRGGRWDDIGPALRLGRMSPAAPTSGHADECRRTSGAARLGTRHSRHPGRGSRFDPNAPPSC